MITIYHWEGDDEAADLIDELKERGLEYRAELLDAENPDASQVVVYQGKLYSDFREFLKIVV